MSRSARSFMSMTRFQAMRRTSNPSSLPWWTWLSISADSRLWASPMALKSPVKCRLMSSIGTTCAIAAAGRAALHAEHGPEARLAQADHGLLADPVQRIAEPDGGRGLALAGGRRADGRHQDQLAVGLVLQALDVIERDLGLVVAVVLDARGRNTELRRDLGDRLHGRALGNLNVGTHVEFPFTQ